MTIQKLSKRKLQILILLYRFRFLTTYQIQKFLHHKNPTRIQTWLHELTTEGYIISDYDRHNSEKNTKPATYCLDSKSKQILQNQKNCNPAILRRLYKEKSLSENFKQKLLFIADLYSLFLSQAKEGQKRIFFTSNEIVIYDYLPRPLPDAYLATQEGENAWRYFLEVINITARKSVVSAAVSKYFSYSFDGYWQATTDKPLPNVLFIAPDERRKRLLKRYINEKKEQSYQNDLQFYITTEEIIKNQGLNSGIWDKV